MSHPTMPRRSSENSSGRGGGRLRMMPNMMAGMLLA